MKYIKYIFFTMVCIAFAYAFLGQIVLPENITDGRSVCAEYKEKIYAYSKDGKRMLLDTLGRHDNIVAIETVLPKHIDSSVTSFCFRGNDMKAYVDGKLRYQYSAKDSKWFGSASPECYMMIPISESDAGKRLVISLGNSEGIFYQNYIGTEIGIWLTILKKYVGELVVAAITMILGLLTIFISKIYGAIKHKKIDILYLGFGVTLAAVWLVVNSVYRQIIFTNLSVADDFPFLMVMLIPFPFLIYMDIIQEKRFFKIYLSASIIVLITDITCCTLYVMGIKEIRETFIFVALACFLAIVSVIFSFVLDYKNGKMSSYKYVAVGLLLAFSSAIVQLVTYFNRTGIFSGTYLALGLICLLLGAAIHTVHGIFAIENDKKAAILANEAKGRFLANMSHEIRTPINAVLGMDEMILRESQEPEIRDYALDIQSAGKNLLSLINDILDISKIESGKMEIIPVEYDVSSMMNDTMNMIYHKAKAKELEVTLHVDENIPSRMLGDDIRIRQVLINLLNNAVKYTKIGGVTLTVTMEPSEDEQILLHFEIQDTGTGIKEEDLPKLYQQFQRIEEGKNREIEGTGLGMSITLQLLELMNSKLDVQSVYGQGSCFSFDLIQGVVDKTPIGNLSERIRQQEEEYSYERTFMATSSRILVVDDNAVNRKVVRSLLKDIGILIDEADSGERCLEMICEIKYDIIFLDHMMPGLDGIQTLQRFSQVQGNQNMDTPVIALTANAITGAKEMYLEAGFQDFLSKPVIYSKLEDMLLKYISKEKISSQLSTEEIDQSQKKRELLEAIPDLNVDYALLVNNNIELLMDTLISFANMMEADIAELDKYRQGLPDEESLKQYRVKVHSMKTSAIMVGLLNLSGMARMLELRAIDGEVDKLQMLHDGLFKEVWIKTKEVIKEALQEHLAPVDSQEQSGVVLNVSLLMEQLSLIKEAVEEVDIDKADEIVELLKGFDYPEEAQKIMEQIYAAVISLDDGKIEELMEQLQENITKKGY